MKFLLAMLFSLCLIVGCSKKMALDQWQGLSKGDSHLLIQDSMIICNGPNQEEMHFRINIITNDSIFCNAFDPETQRIGYSRNFSYDLSLNTISVKENSIGITYNHINNIDLVHKHVIDKLIYTIYNYNGDFYSQYQLKSDGELISVDKDSNILKQSNNIKTVESVFDKLELLDLDNIVHMDKIFSQATHAPCHCLDIYFNSEKSIRYCRQIHNIYFSHILQDIQKMLD